MALQGKGTIPDPTTKLYVDNLNGAYKGGLWFQYMPNPKSYLCPVDLKSQILLALRVNKLCSYVMDGAACGYADQAKTALVSQLWSTSCIIAWEPDENSLGYGNPGAFDFNRCPPISRIPSEGVGPLHSKLGKE